jgi:hypothetical protein
MCRTARPVLHAQKLAGRGPFFDHRASARNTGLHKTQFVGVMLWRAMWLDGFSGLCWSPRRCFVPGVTPSGRTTRGSTRLVHASRCLGRPLDNNDAPGVKRRDRARRVQPRPRWKFFLSAARTPRLASERVRRTAPYAPHSVHVRVKPLSSDYSLNLLHGKQRSTRSSVRASREAAGLLVSTCRCFT